MNDLHELNYLAIAFVSLPDMFGDVIESLYASENPSEIAQEAAKRLVAEINTPPDELITKLSASHDAIDSSIAEALRFAVKMETCMQAEEKAREIIDGSSSRF